MTNPQLLLAIGIPSFMVLLNIVLSRSDIQALRAEMQQLRKDVAVDMAKLREDLHRDMTQLRDSIHRDMVLLHERVAVVKTRQNQQ